MDIDTFHAIFELKSHLLYNGLFIDENLLKKLQEKNILSNFGRKGGAGPAGGRYFKIENSSVVNTQIWTKKKNEVMYQIDDIDEEGKVKYSLENNVLDQELKLTLLPVPSLYNKSINTNDKEVSLKKIALIHGDRTLATTIYQKCSYWENNEQCAFCAIEKSLEIGDTILEKRALDIIKAIEEALKEKDSRVSNITLTSGTIKNNKKWVGKYCNIVSKIKIKYPNLPIHIQIEPLESIEYYKNLKSAGVSTIGLHLEILDDDIRKKICPGKSKISREDYYHHWRKAIDVFGEGQVSTFILVGLENDIKKIYQKIDEIIEIGVIPVITPVRQLNPNFNLKSTLTSKDFIDINLKAAESCLKHDVDPTKHKAGCVSCGGCSALIDAYKYIKINKKES